MSDGGDAGAGRTLRRIVAVLVLLGAAAFGLFLIDTLVEGRRFPRAGGWTQTLPLGVVLGLVSILAAGLARRSGLVALAAGALAWAFGVHGAQDLPAFAANAWFADGPHGAGWLLAAGTALGLFAAAGPRTWRPDERLAAVLVVATTGSANLFSRSGEGVFALLAAGVLLHLATAPWSGPAARPLATSARWVFLPAAAFVAWTAVGVANGEDLSVGYRVGLRVVTGALLCWSLAASTGARGALRLVGALLVGGALALGALAVDLAATLVDEPASRVLATRWRALGMHPNGVGPLFASTAVLAAGAAVASRGAWRVLAVLLALAALVALERTGSRASLLGLAAGGAAVALAIAMRPPRQARTGAIAAAAAGSVALVVMLSPIGARLVARLEAAAWTQSAFGQRWHFWRTSLAGLAERPWTGLGPNQYFLRTPHAEASYYDGTPQDLHPHQLFLAIAEGAGWPAMVLFALLVLALFELARRALLVASDAPTPRRARAPAAAVLGGAVAILSANQLDLGLSQNTFAPLWFWLALALLAALTRHDAPAATASPAAIRAAASLLLFVPLVLHPAVAAALHARGDAHSGAGRPAAAWRMGAILERISPGDPRAHVLAVRSGRALERDADVLALRRERAESSPRRAASWHALADDALAQKDIELAATAARRAHELDPRGVRAGSHHGFLAARHFALGELDAGRENALAALLAGSDVLLRLPWVPLPRREGDPPRVRRRGFAVGGAADAAPYPWDDVLREAVDLACERAKSEPVVTRRLLRPVLDAYVAQGAFDDALDAIERYREASGTEIETLTALEIELLTRSGRSDDAYARLDAVDRELRARIGLAIGELTLGRSDVFARSITTLDADLARLARTDIFFVAGTVGPLLEAASRTALASGDGERAVALARRALRERSDAAGRQRIAADLLQGLLAAPTTLPARADGLALLAGAWRLAPRALEQPGAVRTTARAWLQAGPESAADKLDAARGRLAGRGWGESRVLAELERLSSDAR